MRDCGADCENRIVVGRHRRAVLGGPGAMKERLPSLQLAANDLRQACWQHAVVSLLAGMKETPNGSYRRILNIRIYGNIRPRIPICPTTTKYIFERARRGFP